MITKDVQMITKLICIWIFAIEIRTDLPQTSLRRHELNNSWVSADICMVPDEWGLQIGKTNGYGLEWGCDAVLPILGITWTFGCRIDKTPTNSLASRSCAVYSQLLLYYESVRAIFYKECSSWEGETCWAGGMNELIKPQKCWSSPSGSA